ncbi:MAG: DUF4982 domain-containing protein [Muribaculaceae bacterium]|nr:DUF4982 domain-containing protein [Muribaculaceae bacterium]
MKKILALIIKLLLFSFSLSAQEVYDFNFDWKFLRGDSFTYSKSDFDDSNWQTVNLPHDFQIAQEWVVPSADERPDASNEMANIASRLSSRGFKEMGTGWYRKSFQADPSWKGKRVLLDFEGIILTGDVFLNGERIGTTDYGYLGFESDISDKLNYEGENIIAVRADTGEPDNSRWYTGGGLYRDVKLKVGNPDQYFTRNSLYITTPEVSEEKATIIIDGEMATFVNADTLDVGIKIFDANGKEVYSKRNKLWNNVRQKIREFRLDSLTLENPNLWDTENPYLYTLEATLFTPQGEVADVVKERFGIRSIEYSPEFGLKLNGKKVLLKGIANHHTLGTLGAAAYPAAMEKRIKLLKEFGFNHIRTSHNPYSESFLDLCDEYGILVVDELYDKWTTQYAGGRKEWNEQWLHDVPEWAKRDRNHPSVIMWSLGNELQLIPDLPYNDWGVTPYKLQKTLLNRYDDTRPVTVAMHPRGRNELTDSLPALLVMETDIAAYNYRYMYFPGDGQKFPWMMFYQSEANTSGIPSNFYNMDLDKVIGLAYWGAIDYLGESKGWPAKGWTEGVFDISLQPKPLAYLVKSYFKAEEPIVHIGIIESNEEREWNDVAVGTMQLSENWNRPKGDMVNLYTFTNGDEVELFVNGKSLGRKKNSLIDNSKRNRILWENIPYKEGDLKAMAYNESGKKIAEHKIQTAGKASKLKIEIDNPEWKADGYDLQHITVCATDNKGILNPTASDLLTFEVEGPAEIVGIINGDINSDELFTPDAYSNGKKASHSFYQGKVSMILRSTRNSGPVTLKIKSKEYPTESVKFFIEK